MAFLLPLFLLVSMFSCSTATICVCKDGNDQALQKVIDYACGSGADCTQIQPTGTCYQPNNIKNHCDVAVNSYYQKKVSTGATCDFNGAAFIPTTPPSTSSSCLTSSGSTGTPSTGTPTSGTPTTGPPTSGTPTSGTPTTGTPSTGNTTTGMPSSGTPTSGMPSSGTPSNGMPSSSSSSSSVFPGTTMGPSGSSGLGDPSGGEELFVRPTTVFLLTAVAAVILRV